MTTTDGAKLARHTATEPVGLAGLAGLAHDLALGARLAARGGRIGGWRLVLTAFGIGLCTVVLLLGTSATSALTHRQARADQLTPISAPAFNDDGTAVPSPAPTGSTLFQAHAWQQTYHGQLVSGYDLAVLDPNPPLPPGLTAFPAPGTIVLSPDLAKLLASPDGVALRPRLTGKVVGTIAAAGLTAPHELRFYRGAMPTVSRSTAAADTFGTDTSWGWGPSPSSMFVAPAEPSDPVTPILLAAGSAIVLVPLLIFVSLMSRLAGTARDRRWAAIRLLGADESQLRRMLAGESLVASLAGLVVGLLGFLLARQAAPWLVISGAGFWPADLRPQPILAMAVVLLVPAIAVLSAFIGSRHALAEPVQTVRISRLPQRRLRWRLAVVVLCPLLVILSYHWGVFGPLGLVLLAGAVVLMLISVPILLPWVLEKSVSRLPTGGMAWQLAVRGLQLDAGSPGRVVGGVSAVVAGAIALQSLLAMAGPASDANRTAPSATQIYQVQIAAPTIADLTTAPALVSAVPGAGAGKIREGIEVWFSSVGGNSSSTTVAWVAGCDDLAREPAITNCHDGDVFVDSSSTTTMQPGRTLRPDGSAPTPPVWTVPQTVHTTTLSNAFYPYGPDVLVTPNALGPNADGLIGAGTGHLWVTVIGASDNTVDELRNALAGFGGRASVYSPTERSAAGGAFQVQTTARTGLILGAGLTLLVALAGLLVMAIEQLTERRRALTLTIAAGVPRSMIARSLMISAAVTALVGTLLAVLVGVGLTVLLSQITRTTATLDVGTITGYAGMAVLAVLLVTAVTLPALAMLTRPDSLRTE